MSKFEESIDTLIEGIKIGYGSDDTHWSSIEKVEKLLKYLRDETINLEFTSESNIHALLHEVIS